jgi:hypothetical protein
MGLLQVQLLVGALSNDPKRTDGSEFAWRVHTAIDSWTGKVDTKASIALAIETAVLGFIISLSGDDGPLSSLHGTDLWLYRIGIVLIGFGILTALGVVAPQLGRFRAQREWQENMIYFGHLRHWDSNELAKELMKDAPRQQQLARQLVQMSRIAWRKHVWLQWSLALFVVGTGFVASVGL